SATSANWPPAGARSSPRGPSASTARAPRSTSPPWRRSPSRPHVASPRAPSPPPWSTRPRPSLRCSPVPTVACLARSTAGTAPSTPQAVNRSRTPGPPATAPLAGGTFSPLRAAQRLDSHGYSPTLFRQIVEASASLKSFAQAARAAHLFTGLDISGRHVGRLAHQIGAELAQRRDEDAVKHRQRQLPPRVATAPALAVVEVDGGRLFTRAPGCGPGVHQAQAKEDKVGCLLSMQNTPHAQDPQPQPPAAFRDARRVARLVQRLHGGPPLPKAAQGEQPQEQA